MLLGIPPFNRQSNSYRHAATNCQVMLFLTASVMISEDLDWQHEADEEESKAGTPLTPASTI